MRIFKNTWFNRFAEKEGITDIDLKEAVNQLEKGLADADLGGNVYKMRLARPNEGKSGGFRVIVFFRSEEKTFFVYSFSKSDRDNIDQRELREYKALAKKYFALSCEMLQRALETRKFIEV